MTRQEIEVIVAMYKEDVSYSEIAKVVNKSEHSVKHWVRNNRSEYGLERRRSLSERSGTISESFQLDSKWDIKRGVELIKRKWT
jgi:transposase